MKICVIGLGEIGNRTLTKMMQLRGFDYTGVDIDPRKLERGAFPNPGQDLTLTNHIPPGQDVYIISVWNSQQVLETLKLIPWKERPLVCIESTFDPGMIKHVRDCSPDFDPDCLVAIPHRFNPNDTEHDVFNLIRIIGGLTPKATQRGTKFYMEFMNKRLLFQTTFKNAVVTKVAENAYRYIEIVIAQEMKQALENEGYNFEEIRTLMNSKWNIDVRQALGGVQGKCLPKDMNIFAQNFPGLSGLFGVVQKLNERYIKEIENGRIDASYGMQRPE